MTSVKRFTRAWPCPICRGHDGLARGRSRRCFGYIDDTGTFARCTREEMAGGLPLNADGTYSHRLAGRCRCGQTHGTPTRTTAPVGDVRPSRSGSKFRSFSALTHALRRQVGEPCVITAWIYGDSSGHERFRVLRIDHCDTEGASAKTYRPCHQAEDGTWRLAKPRGPLPLYNLPTLLTAPMDTIIPVLEGEKCVELARAAGLTHATTSAHGAQAPQLTDWSPLAGRRVAIIPDQGRRGDEYAMKVVRRLNSLAPPAKVEIVRLPGLGEGEDIEQWLAIERRLGLSSAEILSCLQAIIERSCPTRSSRARVGDLQTRIAGVYPAGDDAKRSSLRPEATCRGSNHNEKERAMTKEKTKPSHKIRSGALSVTIWKQTNDKGDWYSVSPSRTYKQDDEWRDADSFGYDDLLTLAKLLDLAHTWILEQQQAGRESRKNAA
jgi:hypothetical protein